MSRQQTQKTSQNPQPQIEKPNVLARWLPLIAVIIMAAWVVKDAVPPRAPVGQMKIHEFGKLPVVHNGRTKPLDSLARTSLLIISDRQTWYDNNLKRRPAIDWLADVMSGNPAALDAKIFRIEHPQLLATLGLEERLEPTEHKFRYAISEFRDKLNVLDEERRRLGNMAQEERDVYDQKTAELIQQIDLWIILQEAHSIPPVQSQEQLQMVLARMQQIEQSQPPHLVPPKTADQQWQPFMRSALLTMVLPPEDRNPAVASLAQIFAARERGDVDGFNKALAEYKQLLGELDPAAATPAKQDFEAFFNHAAPFYHTSIIYVLALVLSCLAWLGWSKPLNRTAFWLIVFGLVIHTAALGARVYLSERPPVTNLYSSAVFIGWGAVIFGLAIEWFYKLGIGNVVAAVTGALTLLIAHNLAMDGDTLETLQAVLDTNFWLSTHVVSITLGYTATFVAGFLAIIFILRGVLTTSLDKPMVKTLGRMIYGTLCFALLLSFVGTVLGGLWADDSWGRFWGWDPKENGALIIVLWNALILHARWGGMLQQRGIAVMAIVGNIVTAWSWFGVNMLGVGLHSYGFMESALFWLVAFIASQLALVGIGLLPLSLWRSFSDQPPRQREPQGAVGPKAQPALE